jgi:hypothetical protein
MRDAHAIEIGVPLDPFGRLTAYAGGASRNCGESFFLGKIIGEVSERFCFEKCNARR